MVLCKAAWFLGNVFISKLASFSRVFEGYFWRFLQGFPVISHKNARKKFANFFEEKPLALPCITLPIGRERTVESWVS